MYWEREREKEGCRELVRICVDEPWVVIRGRGLSFDLGSGRGGGGMADLGVSVEGSASSSGAVDASRGGSGAG